MYRKRIFSLLAAFCLLAGLVLPASAAEVECDSTYCFTTGDFSEEEALAGICITGLPDPAAGTVFLGTRILQQGDILTAGQIDQMTFSPLRTEEDLEAIVTYLPIYENRVEAAAVMSIAVIGKTDQAPVAEDSALETYKNLPNEDLLKVKDPEGQPMTYTIIRQPRRGEVVIREDGSFHYTPKKNKVGVDSFTYTATDPAGNVSREATVTITIMKPEDAKQYTDTAGSSCRFAAEWMKNTGIFVSESIGGNNCFRPEKQVSRGEFLTMLVGALDLPVEEETFSTGYQEEIPTWLQPYLAAAIRSGLTAGLPEQETFSAADPITGAEAAVMLQNALDLPLTAETAVTEGQPLWAENALAVMVEHGIAVEAGANLTRGDAARMLYRANQLAKDAPGIAVFRAVR